LPAIIFLKGEGAELRAFSITRTNETDWKVSDAPIAQWSMGSQIRDFDLVIAKRESGIQRDGSRVA